LNSRSLHAKIARMLHLFEDVRGHQHLFRGNATAQRAGTAQTGILLNDCSLKSQLASANSGYITSRTAANNRHVKLFVRQFIRNPLLDQ
jgi:hypothetical protein